RRHPPPAPRFPYTTLFRSLHATQFALAHCPGGRGTRHSYLVRKAASPLFGRDRGDCAGSGAKLVLPTICLLPSLPPTGGAGSGIDRKSTRLNSSHVKISYA